MTDLQDVDIPDAPPANANGDLPVPPELEIGMAGNRIPSDAELDHKYPNRPRNHGPTLPFRDLHQTLFEPLLANRKPVGHRAPSRVKPHEIRRNIIDAFIARWRKDVGDDIFPAFRLILCDRDKDRNVYHLKEQKIGKLLVKAMQINKDSDDGYALVHWKQPGTSVRSAGDFALRCHEIIKKRPIRLEPGNLSIAEVNDMLDKLSFTTTEDQQLPIISAFYNQMNPDELLWLIRIILKQMKIGATEKTFFNAWHPDADGLFNISSSLRRVCWDLWDPGFRMQDDTKGVTLMSCFQPQLAQFQKKSLDAAIKAMGGGEFWIEEKLDGERMQMHYDRGQFKFWSRKAKEYWYLYGQEFEGENSGALTRFLKGAFNDRVESLILDGEIVEWDPDLDCPVAFGTLKTAAIAVRDGTGQSKNQPLFRVFDILYLNSQSLIDYSLADRRRALEASINPIRQRLEIHPYKTARTTTEIELEMRNIVLSASEGLVIKNPQSAYHLNDRNDDWVKVKPEYMTEYGESLDCLVIGAYWGSGRRGNIRSSYLCGLRVDGDNRRPGDPADRFWSFFKVGGGITANEYAQIAHRTEGKWNKWDRAKPPRRYIELAGGDRQFECPDEWIRPEESFVVEVKAASVAGTEQFRVGCTLRFPRFRKIREDKNWQTALSLSEFRELQTEADHEVQVKQMEVEAGRKRIKRQKKEITVLGAGGGGGADDEAKFLPQPPVPAAVSSKPLFAGRAFYVLSESLTPEVPKTAIEATIKAHGGAIFQNETATPNITVLGERNTVKIAALKRRGTTDVIRPKWIFDCIAQHQRDGGSENYLLPLEPAYLFYATPPTATRAATAVDAFDDSYARDTDVDELRARLESMPPPQDSDGDVEAAAKEFRDAEALTETDGALDRLPAWMLKDARVYVDPALPSSSSSRVLRNLIGFLGGHVVDTLDQAQRLTHVLVDDPEDGRLKEIRALLASWNGKIPRVVTAAWLEQSFENKTLLDEERFGPVLQGVS